MTQHVNKPLVPIVKKPLQQRRLEFHDEIKSGFLNPFSLF
jgi:hypothetical protein